MFPSVGRSTKQRRIEQSMSAVVIEKDKRVVATREDGTRNLNVRASRIGVVALMADRTREDRHVVMKRGRGKMKQQQQGSSKRKEEEIDGNGSRGLFVCVRKGCKSS